MGPERRMSTYHFRWPNVPLLTEETQRTNLQASGLHTVLNGAMQAIIGAAYLQQGAAVASKVLHERLISRLL
jgi:dsRNA-specific ribonuclease